MDPRMKYFFSFSALGFLLFLTLNLTIGPPKNILNVFIFLVLMGAGAFLIWYKLGKRSFEMAAILGALFTIVVLVSTFLVAILGNVPLFILTGSFLIIILGSLLPVL